MRRNAIAILALLFVSLLFGCSSGSSGNTSAVNPFAGTYSGSWVDTTDVLTGTLTPTVSDSGVISGSLTNASRGTTATLSGTMSNEGAVSLTITYPTLANVFTGALAFDINSHLSGTLSTPNGTGGFVTIQLTLTKQ